jgi:hypothetical protein
MCAYLTTQLLLRSCANIPPPLAREVSCHWVGPGHTGLPSSEPADMDVKSASLHGLLLSEQALGADVPIFLCCTILSLWQNKWTITQSDKLQVMKPSVQLWYSPFYSIRKDIMLTCIQMCHIHLTSRQLLHGLLSSVCADFYCMTYSGMSTLWFRPSYISSSWRMKHSWR